MVRPPEPGEVEAFAIWDDVLRGYAELVEAQRSFLLALDPDEPAADEQLLLPSFTPPTDLPPMPSAFETWAASLIVETEGLAELTRHVLDRHPMPTAARRSSSGLFRSSTPSLMDQKL